MRDVEEGMKMDFNGKMESLSADIKKTASECEGFDQFESLRGRGRLRSLAAVRITEESDAARKAAIEAADSWKFVDKSSFQPDSPVSIVEDGDVPSHTLNMAQVGDRTISKPCSNFEAVERKRLGFPSIDMSSVYTYNDQRIAELNREYREILEKQTPFTGGGAENFVESGSEDVELNESHRRNRYLQRNNSLDGTQSPGLEERKQAHESHRRAERSSWPGATNSDGHTLRTLEDYDDKLYWSDSAEDHMDLSQDTLSKAEELAEELYRDAMEMHERLSAEADMQAAFTALKVSGKGSHNLIAETKETCGTIMFSNSHVQNGSYGMLPSVLIQTDKSESRSISFSQTSQCSSDAPGSALGPTESAQLEKMVAAALNSRSKANQSAGSPQLNVEKGENIIIGDHMIKTFDYQDSGKDGDIRTVQQEMNKLRESNARKQLKIDSLQKWRTYYKLELEDRDRKLEQIEKGYAKELKKKHKSIKQMVKAHAKGIADLDAKRDELEDKLRGEIKGLNLVIEELSGQLYDMEEHLAAGGIPYKLHMSENTGPSSKTLLSAVIGVKEAAHTFSRTFMSYLKQHLSKARDLDEQICLESEVIVARPSDYKFLVQSFILRRMFLDFDSECYNIDSCMTEIFDLEEQSKACFQEYNTYTNVADSVTLLTDNRPHNVFLREFCFKKFLHIVSESTEEAFFGDFSHSDEICAGRHPSSRFYESYCKLAVSVWLLHRLAFSFQPPARMISVRKGAQFNPTYMESAVPGISSDADTDQSALPFEALVGLMVHPGFRVGSSIIRAQVYLVTT
ncbi:uncharacterized protein [Physcomitrium patens]|uniref:GIL1/IRKI C-terminal domain-containing protein n=1 Tax=Physcomitrium patens TaxID=3218 RepID=A0A2K1LAW9_PHYPA|nr:uncharacterized protein LOC112280516 [Physcomitrium patens]XP_024371872.1 uncharacterized protein LOC112280516 [Physcomitrium patens]XP_024371880.1 uncharacterized protein LOC112280516 [Physcomitrium patens]PNR63175.1 hypothetical protein PHYPA_001600 [Physcomitrium patens]|eukprot:XP_024371862.1 uncharacterized protein LOC112280516 [Physcomitrella patens]